MKPPERVDLSKVQFTPELLRSIPEAAARMYRVLPLVDTPEVLSIAMAEPIKPEVLDELFFVLGRDLQIQEADPSQLDMYVDRLYGKENG
jgi:hypothetical protein